MKHYKVKWDNIYLTVFALAIIVMTLYIVWNLMETFLTGIYPSNDIVIGALAELAIIVAICWIYFES